MTPDQIEATLESMIQATLSGDSGIVEAGSMLLGISILGEMCTEEDVKGVAARIDFDRRWRMAHQ